MTKQLFDERFPAKIAGAAPVTVTKSGTTYTVALSTSDVAAAILGGTCWVWQLKMALQTTSNLRAVHEAVSADVTDQINMIWFNGWRSSQGDLLSNFIKTTLGWNDGQMATLYALAPSMTY